MEQESLPELAQEVANRVRSLQREKRGASAKSAGGVVPSAEILGGTGLPSDPPNERLQLELEECRKELQQTKAELEHTKEELQRAEVRLRTQAMKMRHQAAKPSGQDW